MSGGILLVDDDPDVIATFRTILEDEGYTVYTVNNVDKAKAIVTEHEVQLAIIDYFLHGIKGDPVAKALKKIDEKLQIIFLSGYCSVFDTVDGLEFDVYRVFLKPVDIEELLSTIKSIYTDPHQFHNPYTNIITGNDGGPQQQQHL